MAEHKHATPERTPQPWWLPLVVLGVCLSAPAAHVLPGAHALQAREFGRLFSTPTQRTELDEAREDYDPTRQEIIYKEGPKAEVQVEAPPPPLPELAVTGLIVRSDGRSAAWVNGTPLTDGETTPDGVTIQSSQDGINFVLPGGSGTAKIRPGQILDPNLGKVQDNLTRLARERRDQRRRAAEEAARKAEEAKDDGEPQPAAVGGRAGAAPVPAGATGSVTSELRAGAGAAVKAAKERARAARAEGARR